MRKTIRSCFQPGRPVARRNTRKAMASACVLAALGVPLAAAADTHYRSDCRVVSTEHVDHFGRQGQAAELSHFTCEITGGPLDGFVVNGTNFWEVARGQGMLLGSMAVAQKDDSSVVYEIYDVKRRSKRGKNNTILWESTSWGIYKAATGSAASLSGKTFNSIARLTGPDTFIIDNTVNE